MLISEIKTRIEAEIDIGETLSTGSHPTLAQVESWIVDGYRFIISNSDLKTLARILYDDPGDIENSGTITSYLTVAIPSATGYDIILLVNQNLSNTFLRVYAVIEQIPDGGFPSKASVTVREAIHRENLIALDGNIYYKSGMYFDATAGAHTAIKLVSGQSTDNVHIHYIETVDPTDTALNVPDEIAKAIIIYVRSKIEYQDEDVEMSKRSMNEVYQFLGLQRKENENTQP